jgi:hypothetical protein
VLAIALVVIRADPPSSGDRRDRGRRRRGIDEVEWVELRGDLHARLFLHGHERQRRHRGHLLERLHVEGFGDEAELRLTRPGERALGVVPVHLEHLHLGALDGRLLFRRAVVRVDERARFTFRLSGGGALPLDVFDQRDVRGIECGPELLQFLAGVGRGDARIGERPECGPDGGGTHGMAPTQSIGAMSLALAFARSISLSPAAAASSRRS